LTGNRSRWRRLSGAGKLCRVAQTLSTAGLPEADRTAFWVDAVCDAYVQLECDPLADRPRIDGEIRLERLSTLELSRVTASAQHVRRTPRLVARSSEDYFLVSIQTQGRGQVVQDGRRALLAPGDFALYDSTRPYELVFGGDFQQIVLMLPGAELRSELRQTEDLTASAVSGRRGAGHLMIEMIRTLAQDIDALEPASAAAVAHSVTQILVAGLRTLPAAQPAPVSSLTALHRARIRAYVQEHLADPALDVPRIAAALQLSPSSVHRVFAGEPCGVGEWIWAQRLERLARELAEPAQRRRSVSELAFGLGFNDAAHVSRAFKARFGCSPRDYRARSMP
jgi:AraC-like DNA-binding protein